jgi:hypothetical protein
MGKRWTDKEDGILETLRDGGMTFEEVASIMGRTKQAVQQRASVLKRNEPTFREVVDTAFAKHGIEFGEPDKVDAAYEHFKEQLYPNGVSDIHASLQKNKPLPRIQYMLSQMERDLKPKPQWWKAMMWWRK